MTISTKISARKKSAGSKVPVPTEQRAQILRSAQGEEFANLQAELPGGRVDPTIPWGMGQKTPPIDASLAGQTLGK